MSRLPMRPHKEQDGWRYVRVSLYKTPRQQRYGVGNLIPGSGLGDFVAYYHDHDEHPNARVISSRRVEEAVETADYLKMCADEGLHALQASIGRGWLVYHPERPYQDSAPTLRAAYHRYKAKAGEQR